MFPQYMCLFISSRIIMSDTRFARARQRLGVTSLHFDQFLDEYSKLSNTLHQVMAQHSEGLQTRPKIRRAITYSTSARKPRSCASIPGSSWSQQPEVRYEVSTQNTVELELPCRLVVTKQFTIPDIISCKELAAPLSSYCCIP